MDLTSAAKGAVQHRFLAARREMLRDEVMALLKRHSIEQLPVVDEDGRLVGLYLIEELLEEPAAGLANPVVLMVGGGGEPGYVH